MMILKKKKKENTTSTKSNNNNQKKKLKETNNNTTTSSSKKKTDLDHKNLPLLPHPRRVLQRHCTATMSNHNMHSKMTTRQVL